MKRLLLILLLVSLSTMALAAENLIVSDPLYIGVGARPLGMGKAYCALAEDADAIFTNPAGLGKIDHPKIMSMYSNVMGDINYMVLGGAYPTSPNSAIGAGAVVSNVAGIPLYSAVDPGAASGSIGTANWGSSVVFVSYGLNVADSKLSFGGSAKYFTQGGSGTATIESAAASGLGMDVGAIYSPTENLSLGITAQNPLGTQLESGNGIQNNILSLVKLGAKVTTVPLPNQKLNLAVDCDLTKKRSAAFHVGAEYYPIPSIALRAGVDQDPFPTGVESNFTAGLGLRFSGMEFNYAYHPYTQIAENATHYFSISYVGPDKSAEEAGLEISIAKPIDKSIIYADNVEVAGSVKGRTVFPVKVNGASVPVDPTGKFTFNLPVDKVGKKLIVVEAVDAKGRTVKDTRKVLRLVQFADVREGYWAKKPIEHTGTVGMVQGYPDGTFKPERALTRAELATLLVRAEGVKLPGKAPQVFKDVKGNHWAASYIEAAYRMGLIKGYPDKKFRPNNRINKAEAIAILVRFDKMNVAAVEVKPYNDVPVKHWAAKYVQAAKESGMLKYVEGTRLRPKEEVNRAEAVEMMSKTSLAMRRIDDLLSWDKGFEFELSRPTIRASL
jgi:hypothetical protein